jgi:hypothetical protein
MINLLSQPFGTSFIIARSNAKMDVNIMQSVSEDRQRWLTENR